MTLLSGPSGDGAYAETAQAPVTDASVVITASATATVPAARAAERISPIATLREHISQPLYRSAYALMASTIITAVLGVAYWALAAHFYTPSQVGRASAAVSMMLLLSGLAQANQHNILPRLLPLSGSKAGQFVGKAYLVCGSMAGVAATIFVVFFGRNTFIAGYGGAWVDVWFVFAVVTWCIFTLQDSVLTGLRATSWVPIENTAFSIAKIILLVVLAGSMPKLGLFTAWTLPVAASIFPITWLVYARLVPRQRNIVVQSAYLHERQSTSRFVLLDSAGGLLQLSGTMLLPVVVASRLGLAAAGWFYAAWIVGSAFDSLLLNVTASLTVEGSHNEARLRELTRSLTRGLLPLAVIAGGIAVLAGHLLSLMGASYAAHATRLLELVALGMVFRAVALVWVAVARVRRRIATLVSVQSSLCLLLLGGSFALSSHGLTGIGEAYAGTQILVGLAVLPSFVKFLRGSEGDLAPAAAMAASAPAAPFASSPAKSAGSSFAPHPAKETAAAFAPHPAKETAAAFAPRRPKETTAPTVATAPSRLHRSAAAVRTSLSAARYGLVLATLGGASAAVAIYGLTQTNQTNSGSLGLINAFGWTYLLGLAGLVTVGVLAAMWFPRAWLMVPIAVLLVIVCQGAAGIAEPEARFPTAWLHAGFVQFINQHGTIAPHLDARFSWPGMFAAAAVLVRTAGLNSALPLLRWAPVVLTAACIPSVRSIAGSFSKSKSIGWMTVVLFVLGDWVGQDYFSPQAVVYVMALAVVALVLKVFVATPAGPSIRAKLRPARRTVTGFNTKQIVAAMMVVLIVSTGIIVAHQLTPVFLIIDLVILVVFRRTWFTSLPAIIGLVFLAWVSLGAVGFWSGHLALLLGGAGSVGGNVGANVTGRLTGSSSHLVVVHLRMGLALVYVAFAGAGFFARKNPHRWVLASMGLAPFGVILVQAYGGEAILRSYLFGLPFLAILAAEAVVAIVPNGGRLRRAAASALPVTLAVLLAVGFLVARWGNEQFEGVSTGEVQALQWTYSNAPLGSRLLESDEALPWRYEHLAGYTYEPSDNSNLLTASQIYNDMQYSETPHTFYIASAAQNAYGIEALGLPSGWLNHVTERLELRAGVSVVDVTSDSEVLEFTKGVQ